jgi:hypothetical protein
MTTNPVLARLAAFAASAAVTLAVVALIAEFSPPAGDEEPWVAQAAAAVAE